MRRKGDKDKRRIEEKGKRGDEEGHRARRRRGEVEKKIFGGEEKRRT
jgi:hypothetical protein